MINKIDKYKIYSLIVSFFVSVYFGQTRELLPYETSVIGLFTFFIINIVVKFSRSIWVFIDLIVLITIISCLLVPIFFFHHFDESNYLARLWVKFMPIKSELYYEYAFFATLLFISGLYFPLQKRNEFLSSIKLLHSSSKIKRHRDVGLILILIGFTSNILAPYLPSAFSFVGLLLKNLIIVGGLYFSFSSKRINYAAIVFILLYVFFQSLKSAIFGEAVFLTVLIVLILSQGYNYKIHVKLIAILSALFLLVSLQSIKYQYRSVVWGGGQQESNVSVFVNIASEKTKDSNSFLSEENIFFSAVRFNQGWLVAHAMRRVPKEVPYANGETIWQSVLASFVPRLLWADKPQSGGKENIRRFIGWDLGSTSMNIGFLGEAYVNFGAFLGGIFLFAYGLFYSTIFNKFILLTHHYPTLIFWMPVLFFYAIGVETDILTVINHLIKTGFFIYIFYKFFPPIFGYKL